MWDVTLDEDKESPASFLTLETSSPFAKQTLVRDIQEAQEKLGMLIYCYNDGFVYNHILKKVLIFFLKI